MASTNQSADGHMSLTEGGISVKREPVDDGYDDSDCTLLERLGRGLIPPDMDDIDESLDADNEVLEDFDSSCVDGNISDRTVVQTNYSVRLLRQFLKDQRESDLKFENYETAKLNNILGNFYAGLRRPGGIKYRKSSMQAIRAGLARYISVYRRDNIVLGRDFKTANSVFQSVCSFLSLEGKGDVDQKEILAKEDLEKLYLSKAFSTSTPTGLLNKVWFEVCINFCSKGRDSQRELTPDVFQFQTDDQGKEYVTMKPEALKVHGKKRKPVRMYSTGDQRCPVTSLKLYLAKRNPGCPSFFQRPLDTGFGSRAIGINALGKMMIDISRSAGLSKVYPNRAIRATAQVLLIDVGDHQKLVNVPPSISENASSQKTIQSIGQVNPTGNMLVFFQPQVAGISQIASVPETAGNTLKGPGIPSVPQTVGNNVVQGPQRARDPQTAKNYEVQGLQIASVPQTEENNVAQGQSNVQNEPENAPQKQPHLSQVLNKTLVSDSENIPLNNTTMSDGQNIPVNNTTKSDSQNVTVDEATMLDSEDKSESSTIRNLNIPKSSMCMKRWYLKDVITRSDLECLYASKAFLIDTPTGLLNKVWFEVGLHFCDGRKSQRYLSPEVFLFVTDEEGCEYVTIRPEAYKAHGVNLRSNQMYSTGGPLCPVESLKLYLSKRHPSCRAFFQRPIVDSAFRYRPTWYECQPVGKNALGKMMALISRIAGLSKIYPCCSLKATAEFGLADDGLQLRRLISSVEELMKASVSSDKKTVGQSHEKSPHLGSVTSDKGDNAVRSDDGLPCIPKCNMLPKETPEEQQYFDNITSKTKVVEESDFAVDTDSSSNSSTSESERNLSELSNEYDLQENQDEREQDFMEIAGNDDSLSHRPGRDNTASTSSVQEVLQSLLREPDVNVRMVIERLLQQNDDILAQMDPTPLKSKPKSSFTANHDSSRSGDLAASDELLEKGVTDHGPPVDTELVCAVSSKIVLVGSEGQPLQLDMEYFFCNFCSHKSKTKIGLLVHIQEHRFHCKYCKYQAFSRASVIAHCAQEHEEFQSTAKALKYLTHVPDIAAKSEMKKRKADEDTEQSKVAKRAKVDEMPSLSMEVDEISDGDIATNGTTDKIIIARNSGVKAHTAAQSLQEGVSLPTSGGRYLLVPTGMPFIPQGQTNFAPNVSSSLPVIQNVMSKNKEVDNALIESPVKRALAMKVSSGSAHPASVTSNKPASSLPPSATPPVTVSSGLCWNCGYCGFVTLSQSFLKIHLNYMHQGQAHKYVAMLVSSEEELTKIKESDAKLSSNPQQGQVIQTSQLYHKQSTPENLGSKSNNISGKENPQIELDNAEQVDVEQLEKSIPISFKCAHCNFTSAEELSVKYHMFQRHAGSVLYGLDMKAVKLRKKRYVFYCLKKNCKYFTKDLQEFRSHIDSCTPWLEDNAPKDVDPTVIKSLELTKKFIEKNSMSGEFTKESRIYNTADFGCSYCSYISNNNTRLKKHVLMNHSEARCLFQDLHATQKGPVYFCKTCLWETRTQDSLVTHNEQKHSDVPAVSSSSKTGQSSLETCTDSADKENSSDSVGREKSIESVDTENSVDSVMTVKSEPGLENDPNKETLADTTLDMYEGIVSKETYESALTEYLKAENKLPPTPPRSSGRPARGAALKCKLSFQSVQAPDLYRCLYCTQYCFGISLVRKHMRDKHKLKALQAIDVKKQSERDSEGHVINICPAENCLVYSFNFENLILHAEKRHEMSLAHHDLNRLAKANQKTVFVATGNKKGQQNPEETFKCLYCPMSETFHSGLDIKKHLIAKHNGEEFVYRDCFARKLNKTSRIYTCHDMDCEFTTEVQNDYLMHVYAHNKTRIYECSACQWFTANKEISEGHISKVHSGESVAMIALELQLTSSGSIVKLVDGSAVKVEKSNGL
ncbi:uncharacterized protein LOC128214539 [Mya arenaria]|uniref:uncharacterized protein LOC128214539 n=1 Tax=Mya arenaria TaxID=6604 RepID=UPI0022E1D3BB|nr:uncharacterized protein LOC128214539 [Mya arenaria]XP_052777006.1 uncharacterized protein LOC128214539 [Mya arenaria]